MSAAPTVTPPAWSRTRRVAPEATHGALRRAPAAAALGAACTLIAAASLLAPSQPSYDAWAWLIWGRETAALELDTVAGPAFKPLPVAITTILALAGDAAPELWLLIARAGALAAIALAAVAAHRLSGGSRLAAVVAGVGVAGCAGYVWHAAVGNSEGLFLALALAAFERASAGRHGPALALAIGAGLLRPEAWPFLALYGLWLWLRHPRMRTALALGAGTVVALWLVPDWLASGDPFRSSERARIPNPGAPALADRPALESLQRALAIPLPPLLAALPLLALGRGAARRRALVPPLAGLAWLALVAAMAELGYSGEPRYALPGAALLAVGAGVGVGWAAGMLRGPRAAVAAAAALAATAPFLFDRARAIAGELRRSAGDAELYGSLPEAIERAGGRALLRACGRPVVGRYRGPATAWALGVHRSEVAFEVSAGGPVLRSRLRPGGPLAPAAADHLPVIGRSARWEIRGACAAADPSRRAGALSTTIRHP